MRPRPIVLVAALVLALSALLGASFEAAQVTRMANERTTTITMEEAVRDASATLPANGLGYQMTAAQLEPTSRHFTFTSPTGGSFDEDQAQECLVIPPLPRLPLPCRYYPVWVVSFSNDSCTAIVAINALTGRFAGGSMGGDSACALSPFSLEAPAPWFKPSWG